MTATCTAGSAPAIGLAAVKACRSQPIVGATTDTGSQSEAEDCATGVLSAALKSSSAPNPPSSIILMGIDDRGRPHASRFDNADQAMIMKAADAMRFTVLPVTSEAMAELAAKLPSGKLFASGKAFVPFVGQSLFDRFVAYLPIGARPEKHTSKKRPDGVAQRATSQADGESSGSKQNGNSYAAVKEGRAKPKANTFPDDWDKIRVGHIVLATADRDEGWWTAHVREDRGDGVYVLEWEDFEGMDLFVRRREQIALLHPAYDGQ